MSKPDNLVWPCSICSKWSEKEYKIHDDPAQKLWEMSIDLCACEFDPRYAAPDKAKICPYQKYYGQSKLIGVVQCDFCGAEIMKFLIGEETPPPPDIDEGAGLYVCNKCSKRPEFHGKNIKMK